MLNITTLLLPPWPIVCGPLGEDHTRLAKSLGFKVFLESDIGDLGQITKNLTGERNFFKSSGIKFILNKIQ